MPNVSFEIADLLKLIDPSKLDSNPELKAKIETEQKKAESAAKFATVKVKYAELVKPLLDKLGKLTINTNVSMIQIVLTKSIEKGVFVESPSNNIQVKFSIPESLKDKNLDNIFGTMLLAIAEFDDGLELIDNFVSDTKSLNERYGGPILLALKDKAEAKLTENSIRKLIVDNPIQFDAEDLKEYDGIKYVISGTRKDGNFIFTSSMDIASKVEGAKTPSNKTPKLDANGQPVGSKKESAPAGFGSWGAYLKSISADTYLGKIYVSMTDKEKEDSRIAFYMKQKIAKEKGIAKELASQEVHLTEYC